MTGEEYREYQAQQAALFARKARGENLNWCCYCLALYGEEGKVQHAPNCPYAKVVHPDRTLGTFRPS